MSGSDSDTYGGRILLSSSKTSATDLILEAAKGDLLLSANSYGKKIKLQTNTCIENGKYLDIWSSKLFTLAGGFGSKIENNIRYSEDFTKPTWVKNNAIVEEDSVMAPDGAKTADTITSTRNGGNIYQHIAENNELPAGTIVSVSIWIRAENEISDTNLKLFSGSITLADLTLVPTKVWKKYSISATLSKNDEVYFMVRPSKSNVGTIYVWGAHAVLGSESDETPYLKTLEQTISISNPALIGSNTVFGRRISGTIVKLPSETIISVNMDTANVFSLSAKLDCLIDAYNGIPGQKVTFIINDDSMTGSRVTFAKNFKSRGVLVGTPNKTATIEFVYDGNSWYEVSRVLGL